MPRTLPDPSSWTSTDNFGQGNNEVSPTKSDTGWATNIIALLKNWRDNAFGTASAKDTGTASGNVPLLGTGGKLDNSLINTGTGANSIVKTGSDSKVDVSVIPTGITENKIPIIGSDGKINESIIPSISGETTDTSLPLLNHVSLAAKYKLHRFNSSTAGKPSAMTEGIIYIDDNGALAEDTDGNRSTQSVSASWSNWTSVTAVTAAAYNAATANIDEVYFGFAGSLTESSTITGLTSLPTGIAGNVMIVKKSATKFIIIQNDRYEYTTNTGGSWTKFGNAYVINNIAEHTEGGVEIVGPNAIDEPNGTELTGVANGWYWVLMGEGKKKLNGGTAIANDNLYLATTNGTNLYYATKNYGNRLSGGWSGAGSQTAELLISVNSSVSGTVQNLPSGKSLQDYSFISLTDGVYGLTVPFYSNNNLIPISLWNAIAASALFPTFGLGYGSQNSIQAGIGKNGTSNTSIKVWKGTNGGLYIYGIK